MGKSARSMKRSAHQARPSPPPRATRLRVRVPLPVDIDPPRVLVLRTAKTQPWNRPTHRRVRPARPTRWKRRVVTIVQPPSRQPTVASLKSNKFRLSSLRQAQKTLRSEPERKRNRERKWKRNALDPAQIGNLDKRGASIVARGIRDGLSGRNVLGLASVLAGMK